MRMPQREPFKPPASILVCVMDWTLPATPGAAPTTTLVFRLVRLTSTKPYKVTEDWACAIPAMALSAAKAMRVFFMRNFSKVKHRAPARGLENVLTFAASPETRANPLSGSCRYCTRMNLDSQRNAPKMRFCVALRRQTQALRRKKTTTNAKQKAASGFPEAA